jgi:magnesium transporter
MIRAWLMTKDGLESVDPAFAAREAQAGHGVAWMDFADEPEGCADAVLDTFEIHPLVREDIVVHANRPKVDNYRDYLYLVIHSARWDDDRPFLREIDIVLGERFLITYHEGSPRAIDAAHDVLPRRPELLRDGPVHLLHFILDTLVDQYLPIMDRIAEEIDELEEIIFERDQTVANRRILGLKRGMSALRRVVGPQRDTVLALTRDEFRQIPSEMRLYLRDVYDRMARVSDLLDSFRDETASLLELHISAASNRLNEVIKRLTLIATVGLPLTLVTGWYGMNFPFPEYHWTQGVWWVGGLCVISAGITWWYFKRKNWL